MDTEHVLLALIEQPQGVVSQIFKMLKVDANPPAEQLDSILRTTAKVSDGIAEPGQTFITPGWHRSHLANEETNRMKDEKISTEHMFLAILSERDTPVAQLLEAEGISRDRVIESITQLRSGDTQ